MRSWIMPGCAAFMLAAGPWPPPARGAAPPPPAAAPLAADRWLEIDLYWFDRTNITSSAEAFWERYAPLFAGVTGWRGVILNIGWTVDYVLSWHGRLDERIDWPASFRQEPWFQMGGLLTGTTAERQRQWRARFAKPENRLKKNYEPWTYGDLKTLTDALRRVAAERHGLPGMRVGSMVLGWPEIYGGKSPWAQHHPQAFFHNAFYPACKMPADPAPLGGLPGGIPAGMPLYAVFGAQWGSLSKAVGLEALVLRDSMLLPVQYTRGGPYGPVAPSAE